MAVAYLLLGGNIGERLFTIEQAKKRIGKEIGAITRESAIYETEPWGFTHEKLFLNQVIAVETYASPHELLRGTQVIERELGRKVKQGVGYEGRTIDIDILFYDQLVIEEKELQIPHPRLHLRRFTLEPLAEIAPDMMHPVLGLDMREMLNQCWDELKVYPMAVPVTGT